MTDLNIRPAPGKAVRDPRTMKLLDDNGETKPRNAYWQRRLKDGDVLEVTADTTTKKAKVK